MPTPIDPTSAGFLLTENRNMPMHVAGLHLFEKPEGAGRQYARQMFEQMQGEEEISPLFLKHPYRSLRTGAQLVWKVDEQFDIEHHVRHSALPKPGRVRELLELVSRLHGTRLAWERPLWESHVIEGLRDGRVAMYHKIHHALVDGVSAMRLLQSVMTTDPDKRDMPAPWGKQPPPREQGPVRRRPERRADQRAAHRPRHHRRGRGHAGGAHQDPDQERAQRDLVALALRPPHHVQPDRSPARAGSRRRTGRSSGCAASARPPAPR